MTCLVTYFTLNVNEFTVKLSWLNIYHTLLQLVLVWSSRSSNFIQLYCIKFQLSIKFEKLKGTRKIPTTHFRIWFLYYFLWRLQDECLKRKGGKLRIKLKSEVNLITFNSSEISGSNSRTGLHCHLGHTLTRLPLTIYYQTFLRSASTFKKWMRTK